MLGIAAIPSAIQFIGFLYMPESPRWLVSKGRDAEARFVLQRVRGQEAVIDKEFDSIKNSNNSTSNQGDGFFTIVKKVMKDSHLRKALIMGCLLQTVQQLTGINTVMYYAATIIQLSGVYDPKIAVWMAAATAILNFFINFLGIYLVEKIGRRKLTLISLAGVIVSLGILAIGFKVLDDTSPAIITQGNDTDVYKFDNCTKRMHSSCSACILDDECGFCFKANNRTGENYCFDLSGESKSDSKFSEWAGGKCAADEISEDYVWAPNWCPSPHSWLVLFGLCCYLLTFGPGMGPMPWTINSELFPLWCRSVCFSITTAFNWFFNLLVSLTFLTLARVITKPGAFWLYAGFGVVGFFVFLFFLPETKGRSLESDIGVLLDQQEALSRRRASSIGDAIRRKSSSFGRSISSRTSRQDQQDQ
jgi:SP family myo-inositol transporter-like MFS transporter 13